MDEIVRRVGLKEDFQMNNYKNMKSQMDSLTDTIIKKESESFVVTTISREDLVNRGFNGNAVSNADMQQLARTINECFLMDTFWYMLDDIADNMGIPRLKQKL